MKTKTILTVLLISTTATFAQPRNKLPTVPPVEEARSIVPRTASQETLPPRFEISVNFSQAKALAGYTDWRYVAYDKTDYLRSDALTGNVDFVVNVPYRPGESVFGQNLKNLFGDLSYLRFGGQLTTWSVLEGQSFHLPQTAAPINGSEVNKNLPAMTQPGVGFFFGFGSSTLVLDIGLNLSTVIEQEGNRTRRIIDASGNPVLDASGNVKTEEIAGRSSVFGAAYGLPTLKLTTGSADDLQFTISAGRDTFAYHRDYLQAYFRLPIASFLKLDFGAGLYPTASVFLQPNLVFGAITVGMRAGLSLNYYSDELKRVSAPDAIYFGGSLSARF